MTTEDRQPKPGMGATLCYPSDRYPLLIVAVTAKTITVRRVHTSGDTAPRIEPADRCNGFPVFNYDFKEDELAKAAYGEPIRCYMNKHGVYKMGCSPVIVGVARYYRNYAD